MHSGILLTVMWALCTQTATGGSQVSPWFDDEAVQRDRVHVNYPIVADRVIGLGALPNVRLQRALAAPVHQRRGMPV